MPPHPQTKRVRSVEIPDWLNQWINEQARHEMISGAALIRKALVAYKDAQGTVAYKP
jgi:hypothetical protein